MIWYIITLHLVLRMIKVILYLLHRCPIDLDTVYQVYHKFLHLCTSVMVYIVIGDHNRILNSIAPNVTLLVNLESLLPYLQQHHLVTVDEESYLSNSLYSSTKRARMLLSYLKHKGDGSLQMFLCSLNLAHEHKGHKELAEKLKKHMETTGINCTDFCSDDCKH